MCSPYWLVREREYVGEEEYRFCFAQKNEKRCYRGKKSTTHIGKAFKKNVTGGQVRYDMEDMQIIEQFFARDENAIRELDRKYHPYCYKIAWNILNNHEDSEECVNDTWFSAWTHIPPQRPGILSAYLGKIVRGLAIDNLRRRTAAKRMDTHMVSIEQETEAIDGLIGNSLDHEIAARELKRTINQFLWSLPEADRDIFMRRYWYFDRDEEIAARHKKSVTAIRMNLYRSRKKLYKILKEEEGIL